MTNDKVIPVYLHSYKFAVEKGEVDAYKQSSRLQYGLRDSN